jgi:hypothetical protein
MTFTYWVKFRRGGPTKLVATSWVELLNRLDELVRREGPPEWLMQD